MGACVDVGIYGWMEDQGRGERGIRGRGSGRFRYICSLDVQSLSLLLALLLCLLLGLVNIH